MDKDDEDIFCTSPLDCYAMRPDVLEDMCFAEFAVTYTTGGKDVPDDAADHISDDLDESDEIKGGDNNSDTEEIADKLQKIITLKNSLRCMKKRKCHCIIRFHKEKKEEGRYRNLLMLYYPW
ncbi:Hypothetical predicted protein [Octopus vulgaris]|uniref:Uncharacterized protein n=1 Tax=Octopus vulgaris TaxID=6645 RepID=A0AA36EY39_OCTVU|nr:Hypothetical predicted protein [Octopus vulgaris]